MDHFTLLQRYQGIADAVSLLMPGYAEVVLHDLNENQVLYIAGNASHRRPGVDSGLDGISFDSEETVLGPYEKVSPEGKSIRSISVVLRDDSGSARALLCINVDLSSFQHARDILDLFLKQHTHDAQPEKLFRDDWQERVNQFISNWLAERQLALHNLTRDQKRELVISLDETGAFKGKNMTRYVAGVLGLARTTVFNYLRQIRDKTL
ncbi:PAS domain-containing protein [Shewanella corallii]|uniref:PAS domain-containing protein n=1 Tax=Shewanella corallii TaxID=560080 RepID=A0ABT0NAS9_9GAMM|nr:PAS domain-containing protein [Shewanella corallii]MCL2915245.1 PAS domain-containing protein [Shewanella corallii]